MFDRLEVLIGDKINILKNKTVMIIGLGGVGGNAFETIVRSGVENIIVVDNDIVDITNLNRQVLAFNWSLSKEKVEVAEIIASQINKKCKIKKIKLFLNEENIDEIYNNKIDFVIDAIDTVNSKKLIIKKCIQKKIPFISVMGTGNKMHPELLEITDIKKTEYDPIAKIIRKMINDNKIKEKVPVIYSKEKPLLKGKIGSNAFVPSTAGILAASYAINKMLEDANE